MTSYPVALCGAIALRRRSSTSRVLLSTGSLFTLRTVAWAVWFGPQVPVSRAVESSYFCSSGLFPPISVPKASPGVVRTSVQSRASFWPFVHFPPSEMGFSVKGKLVVYGPCVAVEPEAACSRFALLVTKGHRPSATSSAIADDPARRFRLGLLRFMNEYRRMRPPLMSKGQYRPTRSRWL